MPMEFTDELLSAYLDGELSSAERAQVESQLAADPQARQLVEELRALSGAVRDLPRYTASDRFSHRVVQAALTAKANQNGEVMPAGQAGAPSLPNRVTPSPNKVRRGRRLPVVLAGAAAVAAAVAMMVWVANRPAPGPGGGVKGPIVQGSGVIDPPAAGPEAGDPNTRPKPADALAVEQALARLRLAIPQEGDGLVVRLSIGAGQSSREALDAALAAAGLEFRLPEDDSTGVHRFASEYQSKLAEKVAGQGADVTFAASDAVFVTAPLDKLEKAIAALATRPKSPFEISPLMSGRIVLESGVEGEGPSTGQPRPKHFAQRLAAEQFRLEKGGAPLAEITPPTAGRDPAKPVRVLILVEP